MASEIKLSDDGFASITIGEVTAQVDLYATYNQLLDIGRECEQDDGEQKRIEENQLIAEHIKSLGFPTVSHRAAVLFANEIFKAVGELRKKDELAASGSTNAASATSTASQSSDSDQKKN